MAKAKKPAAPKRPKEYKDKLAVNGSFLDIIKAAAKHANSKSKGKEKPKK
jgi:hypothetical protein